MAKTALRLVLGASLLGLIVQYLLVGERAGLNVLAAVAAALVLVWSGRHNGDPRRRDLWVPVAALFFAAACAVRTDAPLVAFDVMAACALTLASVTVLCGVALTTLTLGAVAGETLALAGRMVAGAPAILSAAAPEIARLRSRRAPPVLGYGAGVVIALPLLAVFGALFASADPVFDHVVRGMFDLAWLRDLVAPLPLRAGLAAVVAWIALGALAPGAAAAAITPRRLLPRDVALGAVVATDLLFAFFVVLQIAYLFGGRDAVEAAGMTYSAYARRGFFELVVVAALVAGTLITLDLALAGRGKSYVVAALALLALTAVVLVSALLRLSLYQDAYGWTELRFYAIAAILFLALVLAVLAWAVVRGRVTHVLQPIVLCALGVALVVNVIVPSRVIAAQNIDRFIDPSGLPVDAYRGLDIAYLEQLGGGAVPVIVDRLPLLPPSAATWTREMLLRETARTPADGDWRGWNLDRTSAAEALRLMQER